jgi:plasmid maintenance system killer protein
MKVRPIRNDLQKYLKEHLLLKKFLKQKDIFEKNPFHPGLGTELLEPANRKIYAFRINRKYRVLFFYCGSNEIEIFDINNNYQ